MPARAFIFFFLESSNINLEIFNLFTRVKMRKETAALLDRNLFIFQLDAT